MTQMVQIGLNVFHKPKGFVFGKAHNITEWRNQARERRERLLDKAGAHEVTGQELNPQNQKQQLTAKVEAAKRPDLVQVFNKIFPERPVRLEHVIDPAERKGTAVKGKQPQSRASQISESDLRERAKAAILLSEGPQLKGYAMTVNSLLRGPVANTGMNDVARPVIDRVNYATRGEVIAMYRVMLAANKQKDKLLDPSGNMPKVKPGEQQLIEEQIRGHLRYGVLAMRSKTDHMAKTCREMMAAANANAPSYDSEAAPRVA